MFVTFNLEELLALTDEDLDQVEAIVELDDPYAYALWWWTWRERRRTAA